ncbi:MAG TPA: hypothetical protein VN907_02655, partial [Actinomycetes bacterium]|nr:hypothetical protein [Actinomycetes bacterium]
MASVVGTAVVAGRVVEVARVVVGTGLVVEESTRAGPDPPQPARAQAAITASATVTLERRPGKANLAPMYAGFPPGPVSFGGHDEARSARARRPLPARRGLIVHDTGPTAGALALS